MQENKAAPIKKQRKIKPDGADGHRGRMFDNFLAVGDGYILPRDIVEMLLFFSIRVQDTRDTAVHLMDRFDNDIEKLVSAPLEKLTEVEGVGKTSALLLRAVGCMVKRLDDNSGDDRKVYSDTAELGELFCTYHNGMNHGETWAAFLDNSMRIINVEKVKDSSLLPDGADMFLLMHLAAKYHSDIIAIARMSVSDACYPSSSDFLVARHIRAVLSGTNVTMCEYFVVTPDDNISVNKMYF